MLPQQARDMIFSIRLPKLQQRSGLSSPQSATATQTSPESASECESSYVVPPLLEPPLPVWKHWRRQWPYWLVGLGITGLAAFILRPTPVPVDLAPVEPGTLQVTIDAEGKTRVRERFVVAAPVEGRLARITLEPGDLVEAGAVVAQIDPLSFTTEVQAAQARLRELRAQLAGVATRRPKPAALAQAQAQINAAIANQRQAEASYQAAQATLAQAIRNRNRAQKLHAAGALSRQDKEAAELLATRHQQEVQSTRQQVSAASANVIAAQQALSVLEAEQQDPDYLIEVYQAQIASSEASLANLTDKARRTTVSAPEAGTVLRVVQKSARFVQAGEPLLEIGNAAKLELVIDILSTDAVGVKRGDSIQIEHWGGEQPLLAKVRYVEPAAFTKVSALGIEEQRVNVIADFVDSSSRLGDGYRVEARIVIWQDSNVLKVPVSALFRCHDQSWCTFVEENGQARQRRVAISQRSDLAAAVERGLSAGEQVILYPTEQITDGTRIRDRT